jgi:hypothetical protein
MLRLGQATKNARRVQGPKIVVERRLAHRSRGYGRAIHAREVYSSPTERWVPCHLEVSNAS